MKIKLFAAALAALFILPVFSLTALAAPVEGLETSEDVAEATFTIDDTTLDDALVTDSDEIPVTGGYDPEAPIEPTPEPRPFTPAGSGTVIDNATDDDGKEFYTIMTPEENIFYLVIDRQRSTENVYFLNAVTEADLMALAEITATPATTTVIETEPTSTPEAETPEPPPVPKKSGDIRMVFFIIAIVLLGGAAGWYFKIYKPKHQVMEAEDEYDYTDDDYGDDSGDEYGDDTEDDGLPPWDVDDDENVDDDESEGE